MDLWPKYYHGPRQSITVLQRNRLNLSRAGEHISKHRTLRGAILAAQQDADDRDTEGTYRIRVGGGLLMEFEIVPRADVTIRFSQGTPINAYPTGATISGDASAPSASQIGAGTEVTINGVAITGQAAAPAVGEFALLTIPDITVGVGQTHDMSQYILDPLGELVSTSIINLNAAYATYDDTTLLLTGVQETPTPQTNVQLEVTYGDSWELPATNYVSTSVTGMLPNIIAPRTDAERGTYSRYDWAYPGIRYEVPIVVQGGAYPFKFEIIATSGAADTSGATIGETLTLSGDSYIRPDNYGVLEWTVPAGDDGKSFGFKVRVTDQDGNIVEREWTGTVQASQFIFYDSTDTGSLNTGVIGEPYNDWHSAFGSDVNNTTNNDKLCYFRTGDHPLTGYSANSDNYRMELGNKCLAYINYPNESPSIDLSAGFFVLDDVDDVFFAGINFHDNDATDTVGKMFSLLGATDRISWWRNTFTDFFIGTAPGSSNPGVIMGFSADRDYLHIGDNTLAGNCGTFIQMYNAKDTVVEYTSYAAGAVQNQADGSSRGVIYFKDTPSRVSIRANDLYGQTWSNTNLDCIGPGGQYGFEDVEICYNRLYHPATNSSGANGAIGVHGWVSGGPSAFVDDYVYRNSIDSIIYEYLGAPPITAYFGKNVLINGIDTTITGTTVTGTCVSGTSTTAVLDASANGSRDVYTHKYLSITSGTGAGQSSQITAYDPGTRTVTVASWSIATPDNTSAYAVVATNYTVDDNVENETGAFDADMNLTGTARTSYLGTHGAEIA